MPFDGLKSSGSAVLVADGEPCALQVFCSILRLRGYRVLAASNAEQALEAFHGALGIGLLLTDATLPRMDGLSLAKNLMAMDPRLKVLFTTGTPDHPFVRKAVAAGFGVLLKPFRPHVLLESVERLLGSPAVPSGRTW